MNYSSPYEIGVGDNVTYKGDNYDVLINTLREKLMQKVILPQ